MTRHEPGVSRLRAQGYRMTPQGLFVLDIVTRRTGHVGADLIFHNDLFLEEPIHPVRTESSAVPAWTALRAAGAGKPCAADPAKSELA